MTSDETPEVRPPGHDGRQLGRYELLEAIGHGGMSEVFRARDTVLGRYVAIKVIAADFAAGDETRERFFREAKSAGSLAHRNIITVYDFGEDNGRPYLVMELLEGESLTKLMARETDMPIERRMDIMMRVCEGLAYAHQHDIVHRDVKPANLFVTSDGQLKILDFGVARIAQSTLTAAGILVGTPDYMSPEQVEGRSIDQRSDVFSAGAVFYQLLSGRKPFEAKRLPELLQKVATEAPVKLSEQQSPRELSAIVMRALEKDPARRYQRIQDMLADLARVQQAFDRQTRALATRACDRYREIEQMLDDGTHLASQLGVSVEPGEVSVAPMLRELPLFQDHGADVLRLVPMSRARVAEITRLLQRQYEGLATRNASWRSALSLISTSEVLIAERDFTGARATLEEAVAAAPDSPRIQGLLAQCLFELKAASGAAAEPRNARPTEPIPLAAGPSAISAPPPVPSPVPPRREPVAVTAAIDRGLAKPSAKDRAIDLDLRKGGSGRGTTLPVAKASGSTSDETMPVRGRPWILVAAAAAAVLLVVALWTMRRPDVAQSEPSAAPSSSVAALEPAPSPPLPQSPAVPPPDVGTVPPPDVSTVSPPSEAEPPPSEPLVPTRPVATAPDLAPEASPGEKEAFFAAGKRPGESIEAWRTRSRSLTARYQRARAALDRGQFTEALGLLAAIDREEPNFADTPQLLRTARAGVRGRAQALVDQGARFAARGEYAAAQASYEEAQRLVPGVDVTSGAMTALRQTMRAAGEEAFRRASAEEGAGRTANAVGLYRRAVELLPSGDPTRARAEGRLRALAGR